MENFIPRKYNSQVMTGLCIAVVALIIVVIYMYFKKDDNTKNNPSQTHEQTHNQPHDLHPPGHQNNDETQIDSDKPTLVLFWGSWCSHSTNMKPEWDKAAELLNSGGVINAIDYESQRDKQIVDQAQKALQDFKGFPDVRLFPQGFGFDKPNLKFNNQRTQENLIKFAYNGE